MNNQKSNKKLYLILGGILAVILIGGFSIIVAALSLMYLSRPTTTFEGKPNTNTARDSGNKNTNIADQRKRLEEFIRKNSNNFGEFKLTRVETSPNNKWLPNANEEAIADFSSDATNPYEILFFLSSFNNVAEAKKDAEAFKKNIIAKKMKIVSEKQLANGLILRYSSNKNFGIMDCSDRLCLSISGDEKDKVEKLYELFSAVQK